MATSVYPGGIDDKASLRPDVFAGQPLGTTTPTLWDSVDVQADALVKMQLALGPDPAGTYADMVSKMYGLEAFVSESQVLEGCVISPGSGLSFNCTSGHQKRLGYLTTTLAASNVLLTADPTLPRWALVYFSDAGSSLPEFTLGVPDESPTVPVPDIAGGDLPVAAIYIAAAAPSIAPGDIYDFAPPAPNSLYVRSDFDLSEFDVTRSLGANDDWTVAFSIGTWYVSEVAGGGRLRLPGFTMEVSNRIWAPSKVHIDGVWGASIIKLADNTEMGLDTAPHRAIIESARNLGISAVTYFEDNWGTDTNTGTFGSVISNVIIDGNAQNNGGEGASSATSGAGGIGLYGAPLTVMNVGIIDCTGWGLMTDWGSGTGSAIGPDDITTGAGGGTKGMSLEGTFDGLYLMHNDGGNWWHKGPHDGFATNIKSVLQNCRTKPDHGIIVESSAQQFNNMHCWGGDAKCHIWINTSPGRFHDIVVEGASDAQIIIEGSAGGQITGLEAFGQGNYNQRGIVLAWVDNWIIQGSAKSTPGGMVYGQGSNDHYGKFKIAGAGDLDTVTVAGVNGGANLLGSSVSWASSDLATAKAVAANIDAASNGCAAYASGEWVYFADDDAPAADGTAINTTGTMTIVADTVPGGSQRGWRHDRLGWGFTGNGLGRHNDIHIQIDGGDLQTFESKAGIDDVTTSLVIDDDALPNFPPLASQMMDAITAAEDSTSVYPVILEVISTGEQLKVTDVTAIAADDITITIERSYGTIPAAAIPANSPIRRITRPFQRSATYVDQCELDVSWERFAHNYLSFLDVQVPPFAVRKVGTVNSNLMVFDETTGAGKRTLTGDHQGNQASKDLATYLADWGYITDSSTIGTPPAGGSGGASKEVLDFVALDYPTNGKFAGTSAPYWDFGQTLEQFVDAQELSLKAPLRGLRQYHRWNETFPQANEDFLKEAGRPGVTVALTVGSQRLAVPVTIASSTTTATVTHNAHNMPAGSRVEIAGATEGAYNGTFTISNVTTNTYDYTMTKDPAGTAATGSPTAAGWNRWVDIGNASAVGSPAEQALYADMVAMADEFKTWGRPILVTLDHEPELYKNGGTGVFGDFINAFQNFVTIMRAEGATNVKIAFIGIASNFDPTTPAAELISNWYPGDLYVDVIGADGYSAGSSQGAENGYRYANEVFEHFLDFADLHVTKDLGIFEVGQHSFERIDTFETGADALALNQGTARTYQNDWEFGSPLAGDGWRSTGGGTRFTVQDPGNANAEEHAVLVGQPLGSLNQRAEFEVASIVDPDSDARFGVTARWLNTYAGTTTGQFCYGAIVDYTHNGGVGSTYELACYQFSNGHINTATAHDQQTITLVEGDKIGIEVEDIGSQTQVRALHNGKVVSTWNDASPVASTVDNDCVGMWMDSPGILDDRFEFDNFSFGTAEEKVDFIETMGVHFAIDPRWEKLRWLLWWDQSLYLNANLPIDARLSFAVENEAWGKLSTLFMNDSLGRTPLVRQISSKTYLNGTYSSVEVDTSGGDVPIFLHSPEVDRGQSYLISVNGLNDAIVTAPAGSTFSDATSVKTIVGNDSAIGIWSPDIEGGTEWRILETKGTVT